ncbi:MAG: Shedu immune nuclease family protein, partial [Methylotenera sp.]
MINKINDQNDGQDDFDWDSDDDTDPSGSRALEREVDPEEEFGENRDPNVLPVTLKASTINGEDCVELYAHGETFSSETGKMAKRAVLLARVSPLELTMFPLEADAHRAWFLEPKYDDLKSITVLAKEHNPWRLPESVGDFDEMLKELPTGFARHAIYGLGFKWEYRLIPEAIIKMVGVTELVIELGDGASAELPTFRLGIDRFIRIRKAIDTISKRATSSSLKARRLAAYNETLHAARPDEFKHRYPEVKAGEIYELIQLRRRASNSSAKDGLAAAQVVREDAEKIASQEPAKLFELKAVIEQVTLAQLIGEFESMLQKNLAEPKWQTFFKANPFVLGLAFPYPVILFQDQASVGGTTIRGNGESIVDFLMAQRFTGNLALIEIKRPSTTLVEPRAYRGDLHAPHRELTASMAQVLDQRAQLLHHFATKKSQDKALTDAHVSSVNCIVVVGRLPTDAAQIRSLDLFRHSSKDL